MQGVVQLDRFLLLLQLLMLSSLNLEKSIPPWWLGYALCWTGSAAWGVWPTHELDPSRGLAKGEDRLQWFTASTIALLPFSKYTCNLFLKRDREFTGKHMYFFLFAFFFLNWALKNLFLHNNVERGHLGTLPCFAGVSLENIGCGTETAETNSPACNCAHNKVPAVIIYCR